MSILGCRCTSEKKNKSSDKEKSEWMEKEAIKNHNILDLVVVTPIFLIP